MRRRLIRWTAILVIMLVVLVAAGAILVTTPWFKERLRGFVVAQAVAAVDGDIAVGSLTGSLWRDVTLHDVSLVQNGRPTLQLGAVTARYDLFQLIFDRLALQSLELERAHLVVFKDDLGWNVARLLRTKASGSDEAPRAFAVDRIEVREGDVLIQRPDARDERVTGIDMLGAFSYSAEGLTAELERFTGRDPRTGLVITQLSGDVSSDRDGLRVRDVELNTPASRIRGAASYASGDSGAAVDARISLAPLTVREVSDYLPDTISSALTVNGEVTATGPLSALHTIWALRTEAGNTTGDVTLSTQGRGPVNGHLSVDALNLEPFTGRKDLASRLTANATVSGDFELAVPLTSRVTFSLDASEISVAGVHRARLRTTGRLQEARLNASGSAAVWGASATFDVQTGSLAPLMDDARATRPRIHARGRVNDVDVNRIPRRFGAPALATDVAASYDVILDNRDVTARVVTAESRIGDATIADGTVVTAEKRGQRLHATVDGRVSNVSGTLLRLPEGAPTNLAGAVKAEIVVADTSQPVTVNNVEGSALVSLEGATVRGTALDRAIVDGTLSGGVVHVRRLDVASASMAAEATGTVAVGANAAAGSDLTYRAQVADLAALASLGVDGLEGQATVEGRVTGPWDRVSVTGEIATQQLRYGQTASALALNGTFTVDLPDRDASKISAAVTGEGTFLTVRDNEIQRLTFTSKYHASQVDVQARVEQKDRTLTVDGGLLFEAEDREIHLREFTLAGFGGPWGLAPGQEATIRYGANAVTVYGLTFIRNDERLEGNGRITFTPDAGESDFALRLANIVVGDAYVLLAGEPRVTGTASAELSLRGSVADPVVAGTLTVSDGKVVDVPYTSARANVQLRDKRVTIDAQIDEPNGAALRVTGTAPIVADAGPIDVRAETSQISLGLAQAFTTSVDKVQGLAAFNLHVTGELARPSFSGVATISNGSFLATPTGVGYMNFNADLRFDGQRLAIGQFSIQDDDEQTLSLKGGADVFAAAGPRTFDVELDASNFRVLNNDLGETTITAALRAQGELTAPRITGRIQLDAGRLEVDELLRQLTAGSRAPYDRVAVDEVARAAEVDAPTPAAQAAVNEAAAVADAAQQVQPPETDAGLFSRASVDVALDIPDDLVLRGRDLRAGARSMGLGNVNLTIGGDLDVRKAPGEKPVIVGDLEAVRGFYEFQGRRFDVVPGSSVAFRGTELSNPALDVTGEREVSGIVAAVRVTGTLRRPRLTLSSRPSLDEGDVLSLIVFNQPMSQLGEGEQADLLARATDLAAGALASTLSQSIGHALDVDLFEIRTPGAGEAGQVNVGRQISERLFVGFRQEFGATDASRLSLEYRLTEAVRILTSVAQGVNRTKRSRDGEAAGVDLVFRLRY